jgi:hypothetical protein
LLLKDKIFIGLVKKKKNKLLIFLVKREGREK